MSNDTNRYISRIPYISDATATCHTLQATNSVSPPNTTPTVQAVNRYTSPAIHQLRAQCVLGPVTFHPLQVSRYILPPVRYEFNTKTLKHTHTLSALTCYRTCGIIHNRYVSNATRGYKPLHFTSYPSRPRYTLSTTIRLLHLRRYKQQTVTLHTVYVHPVRTSVTFHPLPATTQALHLTTQYVINNTNR